jgi:hypothetical protein
MPGAGFILLHTRSVINIPANIFTMDNLVRALVYSLYALGFEAFRSSVNNLGLKPEASA